MENREKGETKQIESANKKGKISFVPESLNYVDLIPTWYVDNLSNRRCDPLSSHRMPQLRQFCQISLLKGP